MTTPLPPLPWSPLPPHGRVVGSWPLLWPGGSPPADGQGGRGFLTLPSTGAVVGAGVGRAVGRGVGSGVGFGGVAVGWDVGRGVAVDPGVAVGAGVLTTIGDVVGVGVGPWATIGPLGVGFADGSTDGSTEDGGLDDPGGADSDPTGAVGEELAGEVEGFEEAPGTSTLGAVDVPAAMPRFGCPDARSPAVNATVARTRLRSPIATTRRARWAEVTTTDGLLPTGPLAEVPRGPADSTTGPGLARGRRLSPAAPSPARRIGLDPRR